MGAFPNPGCTGAHLSSNFLGIRCPQVRYLFARRPPSGVLDLEARLTMRLCRYDSSDPRVFDMCGICAATSATSTSCRVPLISTVEAVNVQQRHRGPDSEVHIQDGDIALGNTRLSIIDLAGGDQPFRDSLDRAVCVFNGEIYNHEAIRVRIGESLRSRCDGSVIPYLYASGGLGDLASMRGMYATAIIDRVQHELVLGRDPFGIKPLYWRSLENGTVIAASELRPLTALGKPLTISKSAIASYLALGALGADESPFEEIHSLAPGEWIWFKHGQIRGRGRINLDLSVGETPPRHTIEEAFLDTVAAHLISDVETALLLSSGVDSAALAWAAQRLGTRLRCVTVDPSGGLGESDGAARTARRFGHSHVAVRRTATPEDIEAYFRHMQRPTIDGLNTFLICAAIRSLGIKVALSGLGADELLGGYQSFRLRRVAVALRRMPAVRPALAVLSELASRTSATSPKLTRLVGPGGPVSSWQLAMLTRSIWPTTQALSLTGLSPTDASWSDPPDWIGQSLDAFALSLAEIHSYLQRMLLPDADAFSMASSVELRVPFVDKLFAPRALAFARDKPRGKRAFAAALEDAYLVRLAHRRKLGFGLPMLSWMRSGPLRPYVAHASSGSAPVWDYLDRDLATEVMAADYQRGHWTRTWSIAALNQWLIEMAELSSINL